MTQMTDYEVMIEYKIKDHLRWLASRTDSDARVYVYSREARDAMFIEGRKQGLWGLACRWNVGRRGWEFTVID